MRAGVEGFGIGGVGGLGCGFGGAGMSGGNDVLLQRSARRLDGSTRNEAALTLETGSADKGYLALGSATVTLQQLSRRRKTHVADRDSGAGNEASEEEDGEAHCGLLL